MGKMTKVERLKAAISGEEVDRPPISLWQHFPWADQNPKELAKTQLAFQKKFDLDFIKVMPFGLYSTADYNKSKIKYFGGFEPPIVETSFISEALEWTELPDLDCTEGVLGAQLKVLELIEKEVKKEVPFIQTVFSPLTTLYKIGGKRLLNDIKNNPEYIHEALRTVTKTTIKFARMSLQKGASGLFFATQNATDERMSSNEYKEFGLKYDVEILNEIQDSSWLNIYHFHGKNIHHDIIESLPVECVCWHDRRCEYTLKDFYNKYKNKCLVGGINEKKTIIDGSLPDITKEVYDAIRQTGGNRLILSPGCVAPTRTPHLNYYAARLAVETYNSDINVDFCV